MSPTPFLTLWQADNDIFGCETDIQIIGSSPLTLWEVWAVELPHTLTNLRWAAVGQESLMSSDLRTEVPAAFLSVD